MPALASLVRSWRGWAVAAAVAASAIGAGILPAPEALTSGGAASRGYPVLLSATLTAALVLPLVMLRVRRQGVIAIVVAALLLSLGAGAYFYSTRVLSACTLTYNARSVLIGTELTPLGARNKELRPHDSPNDLLFDAAGVATDVWTSESIEACRSRIANTWFLWLPFLIGSLVSTALALPAGRLAVPHAAPSAGKPGVTAVRYDVFISYRHGGADGDIARQLLHSLEADGYTVAIDERDFPANASFLQEMERCIRESRYTVAIVSARYLESGHCEEEAIISKVLDMGERRRRLIPLVIQKVEMPAWLFGIVGIDCTRADALVDPMEKLKGALGPPLSAADGPAASSSVPRR